MFSEKFICAGYDYTTYTFHVPAPYFRKTFEIDGEVKKCVITLTGLGFYELYVNGQRLTKGILAPYISNPDDLVYYDEYDITECLVPGKNVLGIMLGNGMQNAPGGQIWDFDIAAFRGAPRTAFCVSTEYIDGGIDIFEADSSVKTAPSPVIFDDLRCGCYYDARLEIPGWSEPDFDDSAWKNALPAETPRGERGRQIDLQFGEYFAPDGEPDTSNICFYPAGYSQRDVYILKGEGEETFEPVFTYHGFRYCVVLGITEQEATADLLTFVVQNSALREIGSFGCSDDMINKLQAMTRNSDLSNFYYFPTDCPHREKNGWTGDAALSAEHILMNLDAVNSYREWLRNIRAAQRADGALPGIVPTGGWGFEWGNGPAWDAALTYIPYFCYVLRGDRKIIEENATAIFRYCEYLSRRRDERGLVAIGLGDWCPVTRVKSPLEFTDSVTCMSILKKAAYIFSQLGLSLEREFCEKLYNEIRDAVRRHLIDFGTMTAIGSCQTSQAMAIYYDVFNPGEKPEAFKRLLEIIKRRDDHVDAGILGMRVLFRVLSDFGEADLAFKMITRPDYPSYGNFVERGLTALPEDFLREEDRPNSLNHHMFGDISAWFIEYIGGIRVNPFLADPSEVEISPVFIEKLDSAEASYETVGGKVSVKWRRTLEGIALDISADSGVHGRIRLPDGYAFADERGSLEALHSRNFEIIRE